MGTAWRRRAVSIALLALLSVITTGCRVVARVSIDVGTAGDGTVTVALLLDREAAAHFPDLAHQLRLDDLRKAGWLIVGPLAGPDGSERVSAARGFRDPIAATAVLASVGGPTGPLRALHVVRHRSFLATRTRLTGMIDLRNGIDAFADASLARQLGVPSLAYALDVLHQHGGSVPVLGLEVAARLPGGLVRSNGVPTAGGTAWMPELGRTTLIEASASQRNTLNLMLAVICVVSLAGLAAVGGRNALGLGGRRDRWDIGRPSRRRGGSRRSTVQPRPTAWRR